MFLSALKKLAAPMSLMTCLLASVPAHAVREASLASLNDSAIAPYYEGDAGVSGEFIGTDGVPIRYRYFEAAHEKGAILLLNGRTEFMPKYSELVYDLRNEGYSIYLMDHRGQGLSGRMLDNPEVGYVNDYNDYLKDVEKYLDTVVRAKPHAKLFLLAHSMGGAIGTLYEMKHPGTFNAMVLSSPMYQVVTPKGYSELAAYLVVSGENLIGRGADYAKDRKDGEWKAPFATNQVSHSEARYDWAQGLLERSPNQSYALSGPSNRWAREAIEMDWEIRKHPSQLHAPTLLFVATDDQVVVTSANEKVCREAADCRSSYFKGAYHEILQETDSQRDEAIAEMLAFFAQH